MDQQVSHSLDDFYLAIDSQSVFTGTISQIIKLQIHRLNVKTQSIPQNEFNT